MSNRKFQKVEKVLIADVDVSKYTTYDCKEHGIYQYRKDADTELCPYCKQKNGPLENINELKTKFKKELNFF